jgi:uncharacterized protein DUF5320
MPRGDRTGPDGMGPMTGRAAGFCSSYNRPGFTNLGRGSFSGIGRGLGRLFGGVGRRRGRGFGTNQDYGTYNPPINYGGYYNPPAKYDAESEKVFLENEIKALNENLAALQDRLSDFSKEE